MSTEILMPALSPTMEEGKLSKWLVKTGDVVKSGTILAEIETDKATMEFEAVDEGTIGEILSPPCWPRAKLLARRPPRSRRRKTRRRKQSRKHPPKSLKPRKSKSLPIRKSPPAPNSSTRPCATHCVTPWPKKCAATSWCS